MTGFGAPIGIPLLAADLAQGGDLLAPPEIPDPPRADNRQVDEAAALASDAERRRKAQTTTNRAGSVAEALQANTAKTVLGGTR